MSEISKERIQEFLSHDGYEDAELVEAGETFDPHQALTWGELRELSQSYLNHTETCEWTEDEDYAYWDASCGQKWSFLSDGPIENGVKFCQGCGRRVQAKAK